MNGSSISLKKDVKDINKNENFIVPKDMHLRVKTKASNKGNSFHIARRG